MNRKDLYNGFNEVDDDILERSETVSKSKKKPVWLKWGAIAACLCLAVSIAIPVLFQQSPDIPHDTMDPSDGPSSFVVNGVSYLISSHLAVSNDLPDGFVHAGEASVGGFENCPYYTNPDMPEWVYVYHEVSTDGKVDATGTLNRTEPHNAYVRYVDERLRGKDLICYNGEYYISMWSAQDYGSAPDVSHEYYDKMENTYGIRIEGDAPAGFASVGIAEFSGNDTIPRGMLVSNEGSYEVYADPNKPDVVLVATKWHTAPVGENGETSHSGFNVYIRYDCPLA